MRNTDAIEKRAPLTKEKIAELKKASEDKMKKIVLK